jgi:hypothetical protein
MSDDASFKVSAGRISSEDLERELERRGIVDPSEMIAINDDDEGVCRLVTREEARAMYIDDPTTASAVQPDVWTLELDDSDVTLGYSTGAQVTIKVGWINTEMGPGATDYTKTGGVLYPTDGGGNVLWNAETMPRLGRMKEYLLGETLKISEERLKMAELVYRFTEIMGQYGSALDR